MVKQNVQVIYYALGIIVFFLVLIGYKSIPEFINDIKPTPSEEEPFSISISPLFINEKQSEGYNDLPVTFTLTLNPHKNITYLEVKKESILVDRLDKNAQTRVSSIQWTKTSNSADVFYRDSSTLIYPSTNILIAEGGLDDCPNCFMGEDYPYLFTFNFIYSEDGGYKKAYPVIVKLPIK